MKELTILANKYRSDKGTAEGSCHGFTDIYDDHLNEWRMQVSSVLEIGINDGSSLRMWYEYFPNAVIYGLDIDDKSVYSNDRVGCGILDQSNEEHLIQFANTINCEFDFIIDDGSHHMRDQQITFGHLFKLLKPNGVYVIEDLHTSLCDSGTNVYGRSIEVYPDKSNTTLSFLQTKPYNSVYLNNELNTYLQKSIKSVDIFRKDNPKVPNDYKQTSITSIIKKQND